MTTAIFYLTHFFGLMNNRKLSRRIAVFCLALVIVEICCPLLCKDFQVSAISTAQVELNAKTEPAVLTLQTRNQQIDDAQSISSVDSSDRNQTFRGDYDNCSDECLCHATPIISFYFPSFRQKFASALFLKSTVSEPLLGESSPLFRPPRIA